MDKIYKAFRLAFETKYWLDCLVSQRSEKLHNDMKNGLQDNVEMFVQSQFKEYLVGTAVTITINVTAGSIIEEAVVMTRNLDVKQWNSLAKEIESEKDKITNQELDDATPKIYISNSIYKELEDRQFLLRGNNPRVPKLSYIIKLAVYYMYKNSQQ